MGKKVLEERHAKFPQVGDYWHEMCCPYFVVRAVLENGSVLVCKPTYVDGDFYWDIKNTELLSKEEFNKKIRYSSIDGFCCRVEPKRFPEFKLK